jgi:hypothetical protein
MQLRKSEEEAMANTRTENELIQLERRYWQAIQEKDVETAASLIDNPCLVAGAGGVAKVDQENFRKIMQGAKYSLDDYMLTDVQVRLLNDDVAILAYKVHEELTVEGKPIFIDASDASTWVKRDGRWVCALHTESLLGDPYGRDRQKAA